LGEYTSLPSPVHGFRTWST